MELVVDKPEKTVKLNVYRYDDRTIRRIEVFIGVEQAIHLNNHVIFINSDNWLEINDYNISSEELRKNMAEKMIKVVGEVSEITNKLTKIIRNIENASAELGANFLVEFPSDC